jgi:hypothetical protein
MNGGVVDQDVERTELLVNISRESFNAGGIRHIEPDSNHALRIPVADCARGGFALGQIARAE